MEQMTADSTKLLVVPIEEMNVAHFRRHMNIRHEDSLGYGGRLPPDVFVGYDNYIERCYRVFHETIHRLRFDIEHEHL